MKLKDIVRIFDSKRRNAVPVAEKLRILDSFERRLNVTLLQPSGVGADIPEYTDNTEELQERSTLIKDGFEEIYFAYLASECSLFENDIARYNTEIAEYTRLFREYSQNISRNGKPCVHSFIL